MMKGEVAAIVAPTIGPAIITLFGIHIPIVGLILSIGGLLLARTIAPPPLRKLNNRQESALTILLVIVLFLIVTGQLFGGGKPLGAGLAVIWGIGLGFSGLLAIELFGVRVVAMVRAIIDGQKG